MTTAIAILVILLTLAYFYLKCSPLRSLATLMMFILASLISFTYYEKLAGLFISRGYGIQWAHAGCFVLLFILSFALLRALRDVLVGGEKIDLGDPIKIGVAVLCGLVSGVIVCGNLFVAMGLVPMQAAFLPNRFQPGNAVILNSPQKTFLNTDGFVSGLYALISRGSMSSRQSFAVLHADYLSQIHLNRMGAKDKILPIASTKCLQLPSGAAKKPVRIWDIPDKGKVTVVRIGIVANEIQYGGAGSKVDFVPAQIRIICKELSTKTKPLAGAAKAVWPVGFLKDGKLVPAKLEETTPDNVKSEKNRVVWLDVAFDVPQGYEAVLLQFKQNAMIPLPKAETSTEEIEKTLDSTESETAP